MIIQWAEKKGLKDVGCRYHRMEINILIKHRDTYNVYRKKFGSH